MPSMHSSPSATPKSHAGLLLNSEHTGPTAPQLHALGQLLGPWLLVLRSDSYLFFPTQFKGHLLPQQSLSWSLPCFLVFLMHSRVPPWSMDWYLSRHFSPHCNHFCLHRPPGQPDQQNCVFSCTAHRVRSTVVILYLVPFKVLEYIHEPNTKLTLPSWRLHHRAY